MIGLDSQSLQDPVIVVVVLMIYEVRIRQGSIISDRNINDLCLRSAQDLIIFITVLKIYGRETLSYNDHIF